jgi:hypothetical protein
MLDVLGESLLVFRSFRTMSVSTHVRPDVEFVLGVSMELDVGTILQSLPTG